MKGINYRSMLLNWDAIIDKLCDECSAHDVLGVVLKNLKKDAKKLESLSLNSKKISDAISKIQDAMNLLDPEQ